MPQEILINITPKESRVAIVENGILQDIIIERKSKKGLVGNIYIGKVLRVLPGMGAAFVDIGLEKSGFLHISDIVEWEQQQKKIADQLNVDNEKVNFVKDLNIVENTIQEFTINQLLKQGQKVIVQVIKDPLGSKGARLSTNLSLASRYLVFLAHSDDIGVSTRIENEDERQRLRNQIIAISSKNSSINGGYIVRTAGENINSEEIKTDMNFLERLWLSIKEKIDQDQKNTQQPKLIYEELSLEIRVIRDYMNENIRKIQIDCAMSFDKINHFVDQFMPDMMNRIELYTENLPLFDIYQIDKEINLSLNKKINLKSGGYIVIDQTEAMTTIDVNTGAFVGQSNFDETILKTNLEATQAITRQLRLRNLGGIIILDFIDMANDEHKQMVLDSLNYHLSKDPAKTSVSEITLLGLVEMTRKRTRESLGHILCSPCPTCLGTGFIKTHETVCFEIFREILRDVREYPKAKQFLVIASPEIVSFMLDNESDSISDIEALTNKVLRLQSERVYSREQFDIVPM